MEAKSSGEGLEEDPLVEVAALTLRQVRMGLAVGLRWAAAGSGMEKLQYSLVYRGVTRASVGRSLVCRSMLGYYLGWLPVR